jgi:hypothetical protein
VCRTANLIAHAADLYVGYPHDCAHAQLRGGMNKRGNLVKFSKNQNKRVSPLLPTLQVELKLSSWSCMRPSRDLTCTRIQKYRLAQALNNTVTDTITVTHSPVRSLVHSLTQSLTYSLTDQITHSHTHSLTCRLTHSVTQSLSHSLTQSLTHSPNHSLKRLLIHLKFHCDLLVRSGTSNACIGNVFCLCGRL